MSDNLNALIDQYANVKAQQAQLEVEKKGLEAALAELAAGAYESEHYRLTISDSVREGPDALFKAEIDAIVGTFKASKSRQFLAAHTTETAVRTHRVGLRNGKNLAA